MNNGNGGWPLALGSDRFKPENFDMAEVAGRSSTLSLSKKSLLSKNHRSSFPLMKVLIYWLIIF